MGNYTRLCQIQYDVLAGVAVLAAKGPYYLLEAVKQIKSQFMSQSDT